MSPRSYVAAGFERAAEMGSGADAVLGYERWTDSRNPAELEAIARYNEEDCRATLALRDWLVAVRPATAARLAPVPQRALDAETVEAASAREALTPHEVVSAPATRSASIARGRSTRGAGRLAGPCWKKGSPQFGGAAVHRLTRGDSRTCPAARNTPGWGTPHDGDDARRGRRTPPLRWPGAVRPGVSVGAPDAFNLLDGHARIVTWRPDGGRPRRLTTPCSSPARLCVPPESRPPLR